MILASCTLAWHTGQLTVWLAEVPALGWAAGVEEDEAEEGAGPGMAVVVAPSSLLPLEVAEEDPDPPMVFWKKSKMLAEVRSSQGLFLELLPPVDWLVGSLVSSGGLDTVEELREL